MKSVFCPRLILVCLLAVTVGGCRSPQKSCCCCRPSSPMPEISAGADFDWNTDWQDDAGNHFQLAQLHDRSLVISMFYASCEGVCVVTKNDLKAIEASLSPTARANTDFVLVTLAPERDSAEVLKQYRVEQGLSRRWHLLRGSPADTAKLAAFLEIGYGRDRVGLFRHDSEITALDGGHKILLRQNGLQADLPSMAHALDVAATVH